MGVGVGSRTTTPFPTEHSLLFTDFIIISLGHVVDIAGEGEGMRYIEWCHYSTQPGGMLDRHRRTTGWC
jgi:hypothetical protein